MTTATEKIQEICEDFLFYLLEVRDENHIIMTKIYEENWADEDECELWVNDSLMNFLGNGLDYFENGQSFIVGVDIQHWDEKDKLNHLLEEIAKDEHQEEIGLLYGSLRSWRIASNGFYTSIVFNYCYRYIYNRTYDELIECVKNLYESKIFMPK